MYTIRHASESCPVDRRPRMRVRMATAHREVAWVDIEWASQGPFSDEAALGISMFGRVDRTHMSATSPPRLHPDHSGCSSLIIRLARAAMELAIQRNVLLDFVSAPAMLVPLYAKLGYRCYQRPRLDRTGTELHGMCLALDDIPYLKAIRSPFYKTAAQAFGDTVGQGAVALYDVMLTDQPATPPAVLPSLLHLAG